MSSPVLRSLVLASIFFLCGVTSVTAQSLAPQIAIDEKKQFGLEEIHLPLEKTYTDPFDPDEVTVQGHFQGPDGTVVDVDGFIDQDYVMTHSDADPRDHVAPQGDAYWGIRFTPTQVGSYTWWVTRKDSSGTDSSSKADFTATADPTATGFIRLAPNHTHFQDDLGGAFYPVGANIAWATHGGMFEYEKWFDDFSQNGGNAARVWMTWLNIALERIKTPSEGWTMPSSTGYVKDYVFPDLNERTENGANDPWSGLGHIDLANAWRFDYLLHVAKKDGMRLMLCQAGASDLGGEGWARNPYNKANGGMCEKPADFLTNPAAIAMFKRHLRYVVARYGWSPNVLAWELFNEIDSFGHGNHTYPAEASAAWHQEMARYLKQIDPNKHLVTTSVAYGELDSLFSLPEIDFAQAHLYNFQDCVPVVALGNARQSVHFAKPQLVGEYGQEFLQQGFFGGPIVDKTGINIQTALWASLASPGAGTVFPWYWDNYIEPQNLWPLWKPVAKFAANVPWNKVQWKPLTALKFGFLSPEANAPHQLLRIIPPSVWGGTVPAITLGTDGSVAGGDPNMLPLYVKTSGATPPITFKVNYPQDGQFQVQIRTVGENGATLDIHLDGQPALNKDFPGKGEGASGSRSKFQFQYNDTFSINVPVGEHTIEVSNTSSNPEGLFSAEYDFPAYLDSNVVPLKFCGMLGDDNTAVLYLYNQDYTYANVDAGNKITPVAAAACVIPGLKPGSYNVEIWSPSEGTMLKQDTISATADGLPLELPEITNDLAIKILPASGA